MGYSCTAKAGYTLDAISDLVNVRCSNGMPDGGFWERGREQADGAVTGTVWRSAGDGRVTRRGSFRINPDGTVRAFPGLSRNLLRRAESAGRARYAANHGTWRERGAAFLEGLESGRIDGRLSWSWFEGIFAGWQREVRAMFAVMPAVNNEAMAAALRDMLGAAE